MSIPCTTSYLPHIPQIDVRVRIQGVKVVTVRDILRYAANDNVRARVELEDFAMGALTYTADSTAGMALGDDLAHYLSDHYKREVIQQMDLEQLLDVIMTNPTVTLSASGRDTGLTAAYTFHPVANLIYTRDQQITTCRGIVMGALRSKQRQREVDLMRLCFVKLGLPVVGAISGDDVFLEGGDFFAAGPDLALVGVGLRTNQAAADQLMAKDLLGCRRLAVVRDDFEQHQDRMHLDCVFSILSDTCCLMLEDMMGEGSPTRRLVDEYVYVEETDKRSQGSTGKYRLVREKVEFATYIREEGYHIIPISGQDQLRYGCNVLNLGQSTILSVHEGTARQIARSEHYDGDVFFVEYDAITSMYGAVHCSSQVIKRDPTRWGRGRRGKKGGGEGEVGGLTASLGGVSL